MASPSFSPASSPSASKVVAQLDVAKNVATSDSILSTKVSSSPASATAPVFMALVVRKEPPVPVTQIFPGEEGNAIIVEES